MTFEIELKLALSPQQRVQLKHHSRLVETGPGLRRHLVSVYFDTPELDLMHAQAALRVRRVRGRWIQTLKIGGNASCGMHQRSEWETPVAGPSPESARFDSTLVHALLTPLQLSRLCPIFETRFWRTAWTVPVGAASSVELALDQGVVSACGRSQAFCEVELELKSGEPVALYDLALDLATDINLFLDPISKAQRGYAVFQNLPLQPVQAVPIGLQAEMRVADAFVAVMQNGLGQFTANLAGLIHEADPEYLHQARVAVRRLRSALMVFAPAFPGSALSRVDEELHWLSGVLGPARDWDVLVTQTLRPLFAAKPRPTLASLIRDAEVRRSEVRATMTTATTLRRLTHLLLEAGKVLLQRPWAQTNAPSNLQNALAATFAETVLDRYHRKLLRRGRHFARLPAAARHRLRIAAKKQRYAAEFFAELYPPKAARAYLKTLAALQDGLGVLNDAVVAERLLEQLSHRRNAHRARACGLVLSWMENRAQAGVEELTSAWRRMKKARSFWHEPIKNLRSGHA